MKEAAEAARTPVREHTIQITDRKRCVIAGVEDVDSFNEQMIVLNTASGAMTLIGEGLNVSRLNREDGQLIVEGRLIALEYDERAKGGGMKRLFK